jgi:hypothetical protein
VPARFLLREDLAVVHHDLEDAPSRRDERQVLQILFELLQDALRQTDGSRCVPSNGAVFDRDLHENEFIGGVRLSSRGRLA